MVIYFPQKLYALQEQFGKEANSTKNSVLNEISNAAADYQVLLTDLFIKLTRWIPPELQQEKKEEEEEEDGKNATAIVTVQEESRESNYTKQGEDNVAGPEDVVVGAPLGDDVGGPEGLEERISTKTYLESNSYNASEKEDQNSRVREDRTDSSVNVDNKERNLNAVNVGKKEGESVVSDVTMKKQNGTLQPLEEEEGDTTLSNPRTGGDETGGNEDASSQSTEEREEYDETNDGSDGGGRLTGGRQATDGQEEEKLDPDERESGLREDGAEERESEGKVAAAPKEKEDESLGGGGDLQEYEGGVLQEYEEEYDDSFVW